MSISKIKSVFENLDSCNDWSLQLLQKKNSRRNEMNLNQLDCKREGEGNKMERRSESGERLKS